MWVLPARATGFTPDYAMSSNGHVFSRRKNETFNDVVQVSHYPLRDMGKRPTSTSHVWVPFGSRPRFASLAPPVNHITSISGVVTGWQSAEKELRGGAVGVDIAEMSDW